MSVPKKRKNSAKTKRGRSHDALTALKLVKCTKCSSLTKAHQVCPSCGAYQDKEVVKPKVRKKKE